MEKSDFIDYKHVTRYELVGLLKFNFYSNPDITWRYQRVWLPTNTLLYLPVSQALTASHQVFCSRSSVGPMDRVWCNLYCSKMPLWSQYKNRKFRPKVQYGVDDHRRNNLRIKHECIMQRRHAHPSVCARAVKVCPCSCVVLVRRFFIHTSIYIFTPIKIHCRFHAPEGTSRSPLKKPSEKNKGHDCCGANSLKRRLSELYCENHIIAGRRFTRLKLSFPPSGSPLPYT